MYNLQPALKGWFGVGCVGCLSDAGVSFFLAKRRSTVYGFLIAYLSLVELLGIYHG